MHLPVLALKLQEIGTAFVAVVFAGGAVVAVRERWWTMLQIAAVVSVPQAITQVAQAEAPHPGIVTLAAAHGSSLPPVADARALEEFLVAARRSNPTGFPELSLSVIKLLGSGEYVLEVPGIRPTGHFGLAVDDYTHSTAPNRRYADLVTQRLLKAVLAGWQIAGITTLNSGQPIPRNSESTNGFLRGGRPNIVGDPAAGEQTQNLFWFNPNAYTPAADGTFGNSGRAEFRQPGRNQTDLSVSKNFPIAHGMKFEIRLDMFNVLDTVQFTTVNATANFRSLTDRTITNLPYDAQGNLVQRNGFGTINGTAPPRTLQLVTRVTF